MLDRPQLPGFRMQDRCLDVPMPVRPDLRLSIRSSGERIVARYRTVEVQAHDLALALAEILDTIASDLPVALRDEELPVGSEYDPGSVVAAALELGPLAIEHRDVLEPVAHEPTTRHRRTRTTFARLGVRQIHELIVPESRVDCDVVQAALPSRVHLRNSSHRLRERSVARDDAKPSRTFGDENASIREECECPGALEPTRDRFSADDSARRGWCRRALGGQLRAWLRPSLCPRLRFWLALCLRRRRGFRRGAGSQSAEYHRAQRIPSHDRSSDLIVRWIRWRPLAQDRDRRPDPPRSCVAGAGHATRLQDIRWRTPLSNR